MSTTVAPPAKQHRALAHREQTAQRERVPAGARDKQAYRLRPDGGQSLVQDAALLVIDITSRSPCRIRWGGGPAWTR
jgi:hypothetical protein